MSTRLPAPWLLALSLLTAGCYTSDFPLTPAAEGPQNTDVLGTWRCVQSDLESPAAMTLKVSSAQGGHYRAEFSAPGETAAPYLAHPSRVGGVTILNVQEVKNGEPRGDWVFIRYWLLRGDILDINVLSDGALKGRGKSPAALRDAIAAAIDSPALYERYCTCVRLAREGSGT
jgi:hypothetical protein